MIDRSGFPNALTPSDDKKAMIIFCRLHDCSRELPALERAIRALARPRFAYFQDYEIKADEDVAKKLSKAVPAINGKLRGESVRPGRLRVESDTPLSYAELSVFDRRFRAVKKAVEAPPSPASQSAAGQSAASQSPAGQVPGAQAPSDQVAKDWQDPSRTFRLLQSTCRIFASRIR